jgi:hypothetical protein
MARITEEQLKKDARLLFRSIGNITSSGFTSLGEEGNTREVLREIFKRYNNKRDLARLEKAYESNYFSEGTLKDFISGDRKRFKFVKVLQGENTGQQRLSDRLNKMVKEGEGLSLLELDLKDEGMEYMSDDDMKTGLFEFAFREYSKFKEQAPEKDKRSMDFDAYIQSLPKDDPYRIAMTSTDGRITIKEEIEKYKNPKDLMKAYQNDELSKEATRYMDMLTKKVGVEDGDVNLKDPGYVRIESGFEDKDNDGIPDIGIDADSGGERLNINIGGEGGEVVEEEKKEEKKIETDGEQVDFNFEQGQGSKKMPRMTGDKVFNLLGGVSTLAAALFAKKALGETMKDIDLPAMPELSEAFKRHFYESEQLAKTGLTVAEERLARKSIDAAYDQGVDNLVRGTGGDRARFLAGSGLLDARRASALLQVAAMDDDAKRKNRENFTRLLDFKENYEKNISLQERNEKIQQQLAKKESYAKLGNAALQQVVSGLESIAANKQWNDYMKFQYHNMGYDMDETYTPSIFQRAKNITKGIGQGFQKAFAEKEGGTAVGNFFRGLKPASTKNNPDDVVDYGGYQQQDFI